MAAPNILDSYADVTGHDVIDHLRQLAAPLQGAKVVHVNSTRTGGGVAEILNKLVPLMNELGVDTGWEVISGDERIAVARAFLARMADAGAEPPLFSFHHPGSGAFGWELTELSTEELMAVVQLDLGSVGDGT